MQYRRISADCHLDMPWMPPDLFVSEARRELKERMPYVEDGPQGPQWVAKNGANFGLKNGVGPGGAPFVPGQNHRVDKMAETGMYEDGKRDVRRCSDPHLRIKDMDRDGVDAEVIYGILGAASRLNDREASNEMLRIYNDFLKDFCRHYPERQIGLACLPYGDIDDAVAEIHRVAKMGIKGLELSCSWDMDPMWHPVWEPLWKAVEDVQLPLHFHTFPTTSPRAREGVSGQTRRAAMFTGVSAFQMGLINIIAALIGAGVLERHPRLRVSFGESGIGWLPYALDRMDFEYEDRFRDLMKLKPSEYWRRQCKATFQFDPIGTKLVDDIGVETPMWGSDYPIPIACGRNPRNTSRSNSLAWRRNRAQDHLRERRQVLRADQLTATLTLSRRASGGGNGEGPAAPIGRPARRRCFRCYLQRKYSRQADSAGDSHPIERADDEITAEPSRRALRNHNPRVFVIRTLEVELTSLCSAEECLPLPWGKDNSSFLWVVRVPHCNDVITDRLSYAGPIDYSFDRVRWNSKLLIAKCECFDGQ